jgi:hypothetical protein
MVFVNFLSFVFYYLGKGKSLDHPPTIGVVYLTPKLWNGLIYLHELSKTVYFAPGQFWTAVCYNNHGFATVTESLKNHSKSQKNRKMENSILLDSTWVDLHNEHIIWCALVQRFCCSFKFIRIFQ